MIIECQTCHTRFRLDETKIKGKGARVKCRKCGEGIIVLKEAGIPPAPTEPAGGESFDLGSAVRDPGDETPSPSAGPIGNLIPFPGVVLPAEPPGPGSPFESPAAEAGKDEMEMAFERVLSNAMEGSIPPAPETDAKPPETGEPGDAAVGRDPFAQESLPAADPGTSTPGVGSGLEHATLPFDIGDPDTGELSPSEPSPAFGEEGGLLMSPMETLDFIDEGHRKDGPPPDGDISPSISASLAGDEPATLRESPPPPAPPVEDPSFAPPEEIHLTGNETPQATLLMDAAPRRDAAPAVTVAPIPAPIPGIPMPAPPRKRSSVGIAAAALAILLAAGGYLVLTPSGKKLLEGAVPGSSALLGGKTAAKGGAKYDIQNVIGYYESGAASARILVIKGQVTNLSGADKSGVRVLAAVLDNTDKVLADQVVFAGNIVTGDGLRKSSRETIMKSLSNRFGEGLSNMHVGPGKSIPFMVVFFDAPSNIDSYKLEARDSE